MKYSGRDLILGALFLALALVLPVFFHAFGLGSTFLPMFYPIIICGFVVGFPVAAAVGVLAPIASSLLTGMPPLFPPVAPIMMAEGFVLASVPAILHQKCKVGILPSLIAAVAAERFVLLVAVVLSARWLSLPEGFLGFASLIRGIPGIVIIFVIVPPLVRQLESKIKSQPLMD